MTEEQIIGENRLIAEFMGKQWKAQYKDSGKTDIKGRPVLEGSIINADGYNSFLKKNEINVHCVEFDDGVFGSDIYSDFEPLSRYKSIEVIGHIKDYDLDKIEWSGNAGAAQKKDTRLLYNLSWNELMTVVEKIESIEDPHHGHFGVHICSNGCTIQATNFRPDKPMAEPPHYFEDYTCETKLESTYQAVIQFINWHNQQNKQKII